MEEPYRVLVGIDWADEIHQVWVTDAGGRDIDERKVPHQGVELQAMADWLIGLADGEANAVAVAIEVPHGPIVDTLLDRGCHVFAINPKQLDRFRDRFSPSGAKDDRRDAKVMSSALRTDRTALRELRVADPLTIELREASREDEELRQDFQRFVNRLRDLLLRVWPELLRLVPAADEPWFWTLLQFAPTPSAGLELPLARVRRILRQHRIRRLTAEQVVVALRAPSVHLAPGVREGVAPRISHLLDQIWLAYRQRREAERRLKAALQAIEDTPTQNGREHHDVEILQSLPALGPRITAVMLAEAPRPVRDRDYAAIRVLGGSAPVTKRSGKSRVVHMRYACNDRLRAALRSWAMGAICRDRHSRAHYDRLRREAGHDHERALRGVVDRLLAVLMAMLRDGSLYDEKQRHKKSTAKAKDATAAA